MQAFALILLLIAVIIAVIFDDKLKMFFCMSSVVLINAIVFSLYFYNLKISWKIASIILISIVFLVLNCAVFFYDSNYSKTEKN